MTFGEDTIQPITLIPSLKVDIVKKKLSSYLGNGIQKRPEDVLVASPPTGKKHGGPHMNNVR